MITEFENDDAGYIAWVHANPHGYIVNVDVAASVPQYPMVHATSHKLLTSSKVGNFTTGAYIKACSTDLSALEEWSLRKYKKALMKCRVCMGENFAAAKN